MPNEPFIKFLNCQDGFILSVDIDRRNVVLNIERGSATYRERGRDDERMSAGHQITIPVLRDPK